MYLVVCYDTVENRRRTRGLKTLREYLTHLQKRVLERLPFICPLVFEANNPLSIKGGLAACPNLRESEFPGSWR